MASDQNTPVLCKVEISVETHKCHLKRAKLNLSKKIEINNKCQISRWTYESRENPTYLKAMNTKMKWLVKYHMEEMSECDCSKNKIVSPCETCQKRLEKKFLRFQKKRNRDFALLWRVSDDIAMKSYVENMKSMSGYDPTSHQENCYFLYRYKASDGRCNCKLLTRKVPASL